MGGEHAHIACMIPVIAFDCTATDNSTGTSTSSNTATGMNIALI